MYRPSQRLTLQGLDKDRFIRISLRSETLSNFK